MRTSGYIPSGGTGPQGEGASTGTPKGVVAVSAATGTFHISHPRLHGPAERTLIQPWLTDLSHPTMNAYTEIAPCRTGAEAAVLTVVEPLPAAACTPAESRADLARAA